MLHKISRRSVVVGSGIAITGLVGAGSAVYADHDIPVVIESVTPAQDLIVLRNEGETEVDLSGYIINWEYSSDPDDQRDPLPDGTVLEAGESLRIAGGYYEVEADIDYEYDEERINNDATDNSIALLPAAGEQPVDVFSVADGLHEIPVRIVSVDVELEHIVLTNEGDEDVDLSGYIVNYHWDRDLPRIAGTEDTIPDNAVIEAGGELVLDTGCTDAGADVRLGDYGNCQYNDDREFVVVLLSPNGNVVDRFTHSEDEQPEEEEEEDEPEEEPEEEDEPEEEEEPEDKQEEEEGAEEEEPEDEEEESDEEVDVPDEELPLEYEATLSREAHGVETEASGYAFFQADSEEINYTIDVDYLCNATQAHIHLGGGDEDGPVVAWLYPEDGKEPELIEGRFDGVLADGTLTEDDFVGEWEGATIEEIKTTLDEEEAYVNIHTEEHPGGEIRGQIGIVDSL